VRNRVVGLGRRTHLSSPKRTSGSVLAVGLVAWAALGCAADLAGQASYRAADSFTSIIPRAYGFFSIGFEEARLGLTVVTEPGASCWRAECSGGGFGFGGHLTAAARKGQSDLFSNFAFNPGYALGGRGSYTLRQGGASYDLIYLDLSYSTEQLKIAQWGTGDTVLALVETNRTDLLGSIGFNHAFGPGSVVGLRVEARRELGSVGASAQQEVCVPARGGGLMYRVCSNRYYTYTPEPLPDLWGGHARIDCTLRLATLGSAPSVPVLVLVGAGSVDKLESTSATLSWAIGAAIAPAAYPGQTAVVILAGFNDATDANGVVPSFNDRFVVSVTVGLPFEMILQNRGGR
jgi:hypothetical protein